VVTASEATGLSAAVALALCGCVHGDNASAKNRQLSVRVSSPWDQLKQTSLSFFPGLVWTIAVGFTSTLCLLMMRLSTLPRMR
jgi:hypothetical protein